MSNTSGTSGVKIKQEKAESAASAAAAEDKPLEPEVFEIFERRITELSEKFPKGIPDKILQNDMPSLTGPARAQAINKLLEQGRLDLYKQGSEILYKFKSATDDPVKDADNEEKVVFDIIKEAKNIGIWIRDIRTLSNLTMPQLNKIVKALENKKLIKAVKSVSASKKKVYMLNGLEPHRSLTGGAWYSDQDFESEFVTVLNQQCYRYLWDKRQRAAQSTDLLPLAKRNMARASLEELWKYIKKTGVSKVELTTEDIKSILKTLIYDCKVEKILKGDLEFYVAIPTTPAPPGSGITQVPCGVCPVAKDCSERGSVNPVSCIYITNWIASEF